MIKQGDIYHIDVPFTYPNVHFGRHFYLVVSNNTCNRFSPVLHVVPLTSHDNGFVLHVPVVTVPYGRLNGYICAEQITIIHRDMIKPDNFICTLSSQCYDEVQQALLKQLGLGGEYNE